MKCKSIYENTRDEKREISSVFSLGHAAGIGYGNAGFRPALQPATLPRHLTQFSNFSPCTRSNTLRLFVTSLQSSASEWKAIHKSLAPIGGCGAQSGELHGLVFGQTRASALAHDSGASEVCRNRMRHRVAISVAVNLYTAGSREHGKPSFAHTCLCVFHRVSRLVVT